MIPENCSVWGRVVCVRVCSSFLCRLIELLGFVLGTVGVLFHQCGPLPVSRSGCASTMYSRAHSTPVVKTLLRVFLTLNPDRAKPCKPLFLSFETSPQPPSMPGPSSQRISRSYSVVSGVVASVLLLPCIVDKNVPSQPPHLVCCSPQQEGRQQGYYFQYLHHKVSKWRDRLRLCALGTKEAPPMIKYPSPALPLPARLLVRLLLIPVRSAAMRSPFQSFHRFHAR